MTRRDNRFLGNEAAKELLGIVENAKENLALLMKKRGLNNSQMARLLGVESWAIGAWLSGKREVSSKYRAKINEYLALPDNADLFIAPSVNQLIRQINEIEDEAEIINVTNALSKLISCAKNKICNFSDQKINDKLLGSLGCFFQVHDDYSIAQINQLVSNIILDRLHSASLSNAEYAKKCMKFAESSVLYFDLDCNEHDPRCEDFLYVYYSIDVHEKMRLLMDDEGYPSPGADLDFAVQEAREIGRDAFQNTAFEEDSTNHALSKDFRSYSVSYRISLDNPRFKESLSMLMKKYVLSN